ncbi:Oligopeptide transport system permease protein AppC [Thermobacillus xylanilyticus]|uniref:Oligopeptide transport system permease protein AppC n=2 Tax=Thermobacillus xylanilyticus TaxID=76633 RepID=A0ABN7S5N9_THEXY|nr:Oligopeptide transport system permease protein AppC [Thermobacillus xylanilyticus]
MIAMTRFRIVIRELVSSKMGIASIAILSLLIIGAILAFLSPHDPNQLDVTRRLQAPNAEHWFGTDDYGRDIFTRVLYGGRVSLMVGFASMVLATLIGVTVGVVSGYFGGWLDNLLMRLLEIILSIPSFLVILLLSVLLKPNLGSIVIIIGSLMWMHMARIVRAETMAIREREYVLYAKASGLGSAGIIFRHVLPGLVPVIIVGATNNVASSIMMESSLSFLGFGVQPPNATWGSMLNGAQGFLTQAPYMAIFPGALILLTVLSFNILGDLLRVALEPKLGRR